MLASGRTPYLAAFAGITGCIIVGLLNPFQRLRLRDLYEAFETGAKYALAVGAAAGTVGIVIGVVTLTGVGFKISYIVISAAQSLAGGASAFIPEAIANMQTLTLIAALIMTGLVCILMGCGIPTTANYLIMVAVAAPTLVQLGVQPIAAHFFVFYFGILADITPPVALAAYAAAGMAGSDPFKTGNTAFRLGITKLIVPFVFVFSPSLLISVQGFTWYDFFVTLVGCMVGLVLLSAAFSRYMLVGMKSWERWLCTVGALLTIIPGLMSGLIGLAICIPVFIRQLAELKRENALRPANLAGAGADAAPACQRRYASLTVASHRPAATRHRRPSENSLQPLVRDDIEQLGAGPAGRVSPCSHLRTVEAVVCKCSANTGWLNFRESRRRLMSAASNSRTGAGQIASN